MSGDVATGIVLDAVVDVVRVAIALGVHRGGELSPHERSVIRRVKSLPPFTRFEREALEAIEAAIVRGGDPLGEALMRLRSREECRRMGAFYTPASIISPMVDWILSQSPDVVVDPGCGSGRFAAAVARKSPNTQLRAFDKDPVATLVTRAVLGVLKPRRASITHGDFLAVKQLPRTTGRRIAWVGNPPYVRHHLFNRALKIRGVALAAEAGHQSIMTAGLHALFFTKTKLLSKPGDVGCYVTPSEWVDNRSGRIVRDLFLNGLGGQSALLLDPETFAFAGVKTTAAITNFVISTESPVRRLAMNVSVQALEAGLETLGEIIPRSALMTSRGWSRVMNNPTAMPYSGPTIGELFRVNRGTATGANGFFVLSPEEAKVRGLLKYGVPTITRAKEIIQANGILRHNNHKLTLSLPKDLDRTNNPAIDEYLRLGERANDEGVIVSAGSNAQKRKPWWSFTVSQPAIVATYMARRPPVFAANPDRLGILNVAIAIEPRIKMDEVTTASVVAALNEAASGFEQYAVRYFGNLRKFEPKTLASLPLPNALHYLLTEKVVGG